jgi:hypothetical protein
MRCFGDLQGLESKIGGLPPNPFGSIIMGASFWMFICLVPLRAGEALVLGYIASGTCTSRITLFFPSWCDPLGRPASLRDGTLGGGSGDNVIDHFTLVGSYLEEVTLLEGREGNFGEDAPWLICKMSRAFVEGHLDFLLLLEGNGATHLAESRQGPRPELQDRQRERASFTSREFILRKWLKQTVVWCNRTTSLDRRR